MNNPEDETIDTFQQQLEQAKRLAYNEGSLIKAGKICESLFTIDQDNIDVLTLLGAVRRAEYRYVEAIQHLEAAYLKDPIDPKIKTELINTYKDAGQFENALKLAERFLQAPFRGSSSLAFSVFCNACHWRSAEKLFDKVLQDFISGNQSFSVSRDLLIAIGGFKDIGSEQTFQLQQIHAKYFQVSSLPLLKYKPISLQHRLKVAYLSPDFNTSDISHFILPVIEWHDRNHVEVSCYAHCHGSLASHDRTTDKIRSASDRFIDITGLNNFELAAKIRSDEMDILIDLTGYSTGSRLQTLPHRAAPVQISYLGWPDTTAIAEVDYIITDHYSTCEYGTQYTEERLYLPESAICFQPTSSDYTHQDKISKPTFIFASITTIMNLNPQVIEAWSLILNQVKYSCMALKLPTSHVTIRNNIRAEFARHGISGKRVHFLPATKRHEAHMKQVRGIDILLDTFPCTNMTASCEALSQGVPVISLKGKQYAHRLSYSILKSIKCKQTIACSIEEYISIAIQLATDEAKLKKLKGELPELFNQSIIAQPKLFVQQLEELYKEAWRKKTGEKFDWQRTENYATLCKLPDIKQNRSLLLCDQLSPFSWHVIRTHCDKVSRGESDLWLIILIPSNFQQQRILSNISGYIHFNYIELQDAVNVRIISEGVETHIEHWLLEVHEIYWLNVVEHSEYSFYQDLIKRKAEQIGCKVIEITQAETKKNRSIWLTVLEPMNDFKVTICMPTFNRKQLLEEAVTSILNQSYSNFELLISDNCSTDDTETYCRALEARDARIRYHRNTTNIGATNNFLQIYDMVNTDLFVFCSDDDFLERDHLRLTVNMMRQYPKIGMAYGQCNIVNVQSEVTNTIDFSNTTDGIIDPRHELLESYLRNQAVWTCALFRKKATDSMLAYAKKAFRLGFRDILDKAGGDYLFIVLMISHTPVAYINRPTANFRINPNSYAANHLLDSGLEIDIAVLGFLHEIYRRSFQTDSASQRALKVGLLRRFRRLQSTKTKSENLSREERKPLLKRIETISIQIQHLMNKTEPPLASAIAESSSIYLETANYHIPKSSLK